jgi:hypothetical protein
MAKWIVSFIVLALIGLTIYLFIYPSGFYDIRELLNKNSVTIKTDLSLTPDKVNIYWTPEIGPSQKIVDRGQELPLVYKEYGPNKFTVTYDHDTVGEFSYWKMNKWHGHHHIIELTQNSKGNIELSVQVSGPDADGANGVSIIKK